MRGMMRTLALAALCVVAVSLAARAEDNNEELAKKLTNPVADLISVPFQFNYDQGIGPTDEGQQYYLKFQPVIPISVGDDWNVISRTILPVIYTNRFVPPFDGPNFGTGDIVQSFFFSPKQPSSWGGIIWGAGPAFQLPTATNGSLGAEKWGAGPTVVMLKMAGPVTAGFLANQIWGFAGNDNRKRFNQTFFQPFVTYTTHTATTFGVNLESSYDYVDSRWTVPMNVFVSQMARLGPQITQFQLGFRSYLTTPAGGPNWGLRFAVTLLYPK
jgi:hypothetical protein